MRNGDSAAFLDSSAEYISRGLFLGRNYLRSIFFVQYIFRLDADVCSKTRTRSREGGY